MCACLFSLSLLPAVLQTYLPLASPKYIEILQERKCLHAWGCVLKCLHAWGCVLHVIYENEMPLFDPPATQKACKKEAC